MEHQDLEIELIELKVDKILFDKSTKSFKSNFMLLIRSVIPIYFSVMLDEITSSISIAFIGHLNNPNELAAIGISETFVLLLFIYPVVWNIGALDTLVSTSFGSKQYYLWGTYLNRAFVILTLLFIPFLILMFFIQNILLFLGQDPLIAEKVQVYFYYRIPTLIMLLYGEIIRGFLQAIGCFEFVSTLIIIQIIFHLASLPIFIYGFEMNYIGVAMAMGISNFVGLVIPILYFKLIFSKSITNRND